MGVQMLLSQGTEMDHAGNPAEAALALSTLQPSGHSSNAVTLLGPVWPAIAQSGALGQPRASPTVALG